MAQLTDLEKVRRSRLWKKRIRSLIVLAVFGVVVFSAASIIYRNGKLDIRTAVGDVVAEVATGSGFPVALPSGRILNTHNMDNALVIVADSNLYTYNTTGRRMLAVQHGMVNPTAITSRGRILLYDRGGSKGMLFSRNSQMDQITSDFPIYCADISENGNFAFASSSDKHLSRVTVYINGGASTYTCLFEDRPVMCVSLADSREAMVVGLVNVSGGEYLSSLVHYQFHLNEYSASVDFPGELLLAAEYIDENHILLVTDQQIRILDENMKELASYSLEDRNLQRFRFNDAGKLLLMVQDDTGDKTSRLVLLDERLQVLCTVPQEGEVMDIKLDTEMFYAVGKGAVTLYDFTGKKAAHFPVSGLGFIQPLSGTLYYSTSSEICDIKVHTLLEKEASQAQRPKASGLASSSAPQSSSSTKSSPEDTTPQGSSSAVFSSEISFSSSEEEEMSSASGDSASEGNWERIKKALTAQPQETKSSPAQSSG